MKKIGLHPLFILLGLLLIVLGFGFLFFVYLLAVILHELAHAFIAKRLGYKINKVFLLPFGAQLSLEQNFVDEKDEIYVALAGPLFNFILAFFCISLWWIEPEIFNYTKEFVFANFVNGLVNLLPCYPLDGGRIFVACLKRKIERKRALNICFIFNYLISAIFFILFLFYLKSGINLTFAIMAIFIFFGTFENKYGGSYNFLSFNLENEKNKFKKYISVKVFAVKSNIELYKIIKYTDKNKYNIIYVISQNEDIKIITQKTLKSLLLKYPLKTKLNEIYRI
ncbi:MAG: site-2 protease family protein [Clostridia bacterium]|jgi:stage IV sporulation protein FB|nr:site-2 protease family protein [Clostridia bacterium]